MNLFSELSLWLAPSATRNGLTSLTAFGVLAGLSTAS